MPLTHCRRADNPNKCKADFPRTQWLIEKAAVLCQGLMKIMGMNSGGKRNFKRRKMFKSGTLAIILVRPRPALATKPKNAVKDTENYTAT